MKTAAIVGDGGLDKLCPSLLKPAAKVQRANWGAGEPLQRLTEAVKDCDSSTGSALDTIYNNLSLRSFAIAVGISASTLMAYVRKDNKRYNPGDSAGRPPLLTARNQCFIRNVLARKDRANEGENYQEAVDLVQELDTKLTQEQARHHLSRTLLKGDTSIVKAKSVVAQQTTTKRSNITVPQQY
jgi:transposase